MGHTGVVALVAPFISPVLRKHCLPYIPSTQQQVAQLEHASPHDSQLAVADQPRPEADTKG